jgi:AcrR family transcriptional regulator
MGNRKRQGIGAGLPRRALRRDAQQRRIRLISSAMELFERDGYEVPLEQIAAHAGIGRGTLYRNFKDRAALGLAVLEHGSQRLLDAVSARRSDPETLFWLLQEGAIFGALHAPAVDSAESDPVMRKRLAALRSRAYRVILPSIRSAQAAGLLRKDFSQAEFWLLVHLLKAHAITIPVARRARAIRGALRLLSRGIAPSPRKLHGS